MGNVKVEIQKSCLKSGTTLANAEGLEEEKGYGV
jgi:hypothetical protein